MTKKIRIPDSIEKAEGRLADLEGIATATGWERAAIVFAFTYEGKPGPKIAREVVRSTIRDFARKGIVGLKSQDSVRLHREAWKHAMEKAGAADIGPGDTVILPTIDFPPMRTGTDGYSTAEGAQKTLNKIIKKHGAGVVASTAAKADPKAAAQQLQKPEVAKAAMQSSKTRQAIAQGAKAARAKPGPQPKMPTKKDLDKQDRAERELNALELQAMITEFHIVVGAAGDTRKAVDSFRQMEQYLTAEQRQDLADLVQETIDHWDMLRSAITNPVTDEALQSLIDGAV